MIQSRGITEGPTFSLFGKENEIMKRMIESMMKNIGSMILLKYLLFGERLTKNQMTRKMITEKITRKYNDLPVESFAIKFVASVFMIPIF